MFTWDIVNGSNPKLYKQQKKVSSEKNNKNNICSVLQIAIQYNLKKKFLLVNIQEKKTNNNNTATKKKGVLSLKLRLQIWELPE